MIQFQILETLKAKALANGWLFVIGFDDFMKNYETNREFANDQLILVADVNFKPRFKNSRTMSIDYNCFLSLGKKFDTDGTVVSLDETNEQKYDRRLGTLVFELSSFIAEFGCENELTIQDPTINFAINQFDENLDFAIASNVAFNQLGGNEPTI